tara:strand:- start:660 stop:839 length:180 start_codon:yes stop_codon:yes gene_type:complete
MSQHLIKEVQQLKYEVRMLKEDNHNQVEKNRIAIVKIAEMLEDVIGKMEILAARLPRSG